MSTVPQALRVFLLRSEAADDQSFELQLRGSGHEVTTITSLHEAISVLGTEKPDLVAFSPVSEFGLSDSIRKLRASFDGVIVATGITTKSSVAAMLPRLGISTFAKTPEDLLEVVKEVSDRRELEAEIQN